VNDPAPRHSIRKLAELTGTTVRTLRRWVHTGAISPTDFRGPATSYGARHVDEAQAVKRLLAENLSLEAIRARLTRLSDDELARFLRPEPIANVVGPGASEVAAAPDTPAVTSTIPTGPLESTPTDLEGSSAVERWEHVTLLPGLQLLVRSDSGALVRRIAQEIRERYAVAKS
jgi:DNA-binding transcriptional MerR regulator